MNTEQRILAAAMDSRKACDAIVKHLDQEDLTEPGKLVLETVDQYYDRDPKALQVDGATIRGLVMQRVSNPKHKETFEVVMDRLAEVQVSGINVAAELLGAKREAAAAKLSTMLATNEDAEAEIEEYLELCRATSLDEDKEQHELLNMPTIDDLVGTEEQGDLIPMYPKALNERLEGGLIRGHHVLVFARPEMGKTMFLVNLTRGFLRHGLKVLYVGNEEPVKLTFIRMVQRLTDMTRYEVLSQRDAAIEKAKDNGLANLYMKQVTPGTPREIEALCEEVKPDVLIVDQLRHMSVGKTDGNFVRQLEMAANAVRQIGSRQNCLAISVTQAGESAAGKPVLDMEDVDFSNTGIQGAVDVMIGIGASKDDENAGRRVISLPKNKRTGRHDFFPVEVDIQLNRVISMDC